MKIVIAETQSHIRAALRLLISEQTEHIVVLEIMFIDTLCSQLIEIPADILIVDWSFLASNTKDLFKTIRDDTTVKHIVVISSKPMIRDIAMQAGADVFLSKSDPPDAILSYLQHLNHVSQPDGQ